MNRILLVVQAWLLGLSWILADPASAVDVLERGGGVYLELPGTLDFVHVVDRLQTEIQAKNWEVIKVQAVDKGLKDHYQMGIQNKVIYVCKSQYLAQAVKEDPNISLIVPCRIAVYRVDAEGKAAGPMSGKGGKIVVGFEDPAQEATHLRIRQAQAAKVAGKELREVLQGLGDYFEKK